MHGVKKSALPEEEKSAQEKKKANKLRAFIQARDRVFEKRGAGEYDEELMTMTGELLTRNPDIYTLWNIRREAIQRRFSKKEAEESDEEHQARLVLLYDGELRLTQECLLSNPKSYSTWHHRALMVAQHPRADLRAELELCEKALTADCRNFHCWDHRRSMARLARLSDAEEIGFSDRLIGKNPSNYSAWHYRGTLLPRLRPNEANPECAISDECLAEEFEKVLHVCGVNSEDQTAWTYCRWLVEIATAKAKGPSKQLLSARFVDASNVQMVFSDAVDAKTVKSLLILDDQSTLESIQCKALSPFPAPAAAAAWQCAHVWLLSAVPSGSGKLKFHLFPPAPADSSSSSPSADQQQPSPTQPPIGQICNDENNDRAADGGGKSYANVDWLKQYFSPAPTCTREVPRKCLNDLIQLCDQLIPVEDNPWELAALIRAKIALNGVNEPTMNLALENCEKLKKIDSQRAAMYAELVDRLRVVNALNAVDIHGAEGGTAASSITKLESLLSPGSAGCLTLSGQGLNSLTHLRPLAGLVRTLHLEDNLLGDLQLPQLAVFGGGLTHLSLDGNPIQRFPRLHLPRLQFLSLARTRVRRCADVEAAVTQLDSLQRLVLCETPLASDEEEAKAVRDLLLTTKKGGLRLIFHWM